jgi:hypothetical protein
MARSPELLALSTALARAARKHKAQQSAESAHELAMAKAEWARARFDAEAADIATYLRRILESTPTLTDAQRDQVINTVAG